MVEMVRLNVEAVVDLTGRFLGPMVDRGRGAVINVASLGAFQPLPGSAVYGAGKAFVLSFSEAIRTELRGTVSASRRSARDLCGPSSPRLPASAVSRIEHPAPSGCRRKMSPGKPSTAPSTTAAWSFPARSTVRPPSPDSTVRGR